MVRKEIEDETNKLTGKSKQISPVAIHLSIYSPNGKEIIFCIFIWGAIYSLLWNPLMAFAIVVTGRESVISPCYFYMYPENLVVFYYLSLFVLFIILFDAVSLVFSYHVMRLVYQLQVIQSAVFLIELHFASLCCSSTNIFLIEGEI